MTLRQILTPLNRCLGRIFYLKSVLSKRGHPKNRSMLTPLSRYLFKIILSEKYLEQEGTSEKSEHIDPPEQILV